MGTTTSTCLVFVLDRRRVSTREASRWPPMSLTTSGAGNRERLWGEKVESPEVPHSTQTGIAPGMRGELQQDQEPETMDQGRSVSPNLATDRRHQGQRGRPPPLIRKLP